MPLKWPDFKDVLARLWRRRDGRRAAVVSVPAAKRPAPPKRIYLRYRLRYPVLRGGTETQPYNQADYGVKELRTALLKMTRDRMWEPEFQAETEDGEHVADFHLETAKANIDAYGIRGFVGHLQEHLHEVLRNYERGEEPAGPVVVRWD